jgi:hypothetical protein
MANCGNCGTKLGMGKSGECQDCQSKREQTAAATASQRLAAQQADYNSKVDAYVSRVTTSIDSVLAAGGTAYLYASTYLDVDALFEDIKGPEGLSLAGLGSWGASGWEVVGVVPRTYSGSKTYVAKNKVTATSWGGGSTVQQMSLSGNVIGAYSLLRLPITTSTRSLYDEEIRKVSTRNIVNELGPRPTS